MIYSHQLQSDSTTFPKGFSAKQRHPKQRPTENHRQVIAPRSAEPRPYSRSNLIDREDTSPSCVANRFSRAEGKCFGGWREESLIWKLLTKQKKKKIHSMSGL